MSITVLKVSQPFYCFTTFICHAVIISPGCRVRASLMLCFSSIGVLKNDSVINDQIPFPYYYHIHIPTSYYSLWSRQRDNCHASGLVLVLFLIAVEAEPY